MKTIAIGIALALASPSTPKSPPELAPPPSPAEPAPPPSPAEPAPPSVTTEPAPPVTTEPGSPEATEPATPEPEATEPATPEPATPEPQTRPVITKPVPSPEPEPVRERGPGDRMVKAGVGVVIAGVASYLVMAAGLGIGNGAEGDLFSLSGREDIGTRRDVLARGQLGNRLAIGGAIVATVAMAVGIPLIVIGRRRHEAASSRTTVMVSGGPGGLGLRLQSRF